MWSNFHNTIIQGYMKVIGLYIFCPEDGSLKPLNAQTDTLEGCLWEAWGKKWHEVLCILYGVMQCSGMQGYFLHSVGIKS